MLYKIIFLFFLISCEKGNDLKLFDAQSYLTLATTYKVTLLRAKSLNTGKEIKRPVATWWPLIEFETIGPTATKTKKFCLIFKVPNKKNGELKLLELKNKNCSRELLSSTKVHLKSIENLKVYLTGKKIKGIPPLHLVLIFKMKGKDFEFKYPLLNLVEENIRDLGNFKLKKSSYEIKRFSSGSAQTIYPGAVFWPSLNRDVEKDFLLGSKTDNFFERTSVRCHQVNEKCETVGEYSCDRCRFGWHEVVPTKCPQTGDKFCGILNCGKKGFPACYRGYAYLGTQIKFGCYQDNPAGFCDHGLKAMCDSKGVLVCN